MSWEESLAFIESLTILSWLVINRDYALAEGLLAGCVKTKTPGIVTFGSTAQSAITFDINQCASELPYSMLGAAALYGKIQLMQQLIYLGAEVNPSERDVCTPLILAIVSRSKDAVELLLQHGADVNAVSSAFEIPLIKAVREKVIPDIVSVLLAYGADLHHRDELGTALDSAIFYRYTRMVRLLWDSHFPESEWNRKAEGYQFDAATVHNIDYHDENHCDKDYEFFNDVSSRDSTHRQYGKYSDITDTTSFKTI